MTGAGLKELAELKSLHTLYLGGTQVTDAGLKELAGLKSLHTLDHRGTKVTDAGLKELAGLKLKIEPRAILFAASYAANRIAFTSDNKTLVTSPQFEGIRFWDVDKKAARPEPNLSNDGYDLLNFRLLQTAHNFALSPDGKTLAAGRGERLLLFDVASGKMRHSCKHEKTIINLHFTSDGKKLFTASQEGDIKVWDVAAGKEVRALFGRIEDIHQVDLSPDGKLLAVHSDNKVTLWDVANDKALLAWASLTIRINSKCHGFTPDGKHLAIAWAINPGEAKLGLWDVATGKLVRSFNLPTVFIPNVTICPNVTFSPNGKFVAIAIGNSILLWDLATERTVATFVGRGGCMAFSPDGKILAAGDYSERIRLWDVPSKFAQSAKDKEK